MVATAIQLIGLAAIVVGVGLFSVPAAVVAFGIGAVLFGTALERE
jgi:hypothetical protein